MKGYQALAEALIAEGVRHVFAVPGEDNMLWLTDLMASKKVEVIRARRESGAIGMADGYARVTDLPGVCTVTMGPGLTNAATQLVTASRHGSPVICIVGEAPVFDRNNAKGLNQRRFAEGTETAYLSVRHVETLAADIQFAFRHARSGCGPVVLGLCRDFLQSELDMWEYVTSSTVTPAGQRAYPDPEVIAQAVGILRSAHRPVIVIGRGAVVSQAEDEIRTLAERIGAILAYSFLGRPYLADHPFNIGMAGGFASDFGHDLLAEADCIVAVGCSLNTYTTEAGMLFADAQIIQIDKNPAQIAKFIPVTLGIVADARAAIAQLNRELDRQGVRRPGFWNDDMRARIAASRLNGDNDDTGDSGYVGTTDCIDPRRFLVALNKMLPADRIVVMDNGHCGIFADPDSRIGVPEARDFVRTGDFASIGMGLFQGIGAAIGRPNRHVVVITGDGGFMMSLEELDTAVRYRVPMTVVVMNDGGFGVEVHFLNAMQKPVDVGLYDNPAFARVAEALGAEGVTVHQVADLTALAERIGRGDGPLLVDAKIHRVPHPRLQGMMQAMHLG